LNFFNSKKANLDRDRMSNAGKMAKGMGIQASFGIPYQAQVCH
jgi:hypothetical protein